MPATSSFVPVMSSGGFVFVAGLMAAWKPGDLGGIAPEAKVPEGHLWKGNRIQLELDYLVQRKLKVALEGAGSSLARVVKADVSIRDVNDVPAFNQIWAKAFPGDVPATTFWPTSNPGFAIEDARIEINCVATVGDLAAERVALPRAAPALCDGYPAAMRAGDLLFVSGLVAADDKGRVKKEMEYLIGLADEICRKAGTKLENVLRIQQVHTELRTFRAPAARGRSACRACRCRCRPSRCRSRSSFPVVRCNSIFGSTVLRRNKCQPSDACSLRLPFSGSGQRPRRSPTRTARCA